MVKRDRLVAIRGSQYALSAKERRTGKSVGENHNHSGGGWTVFKTCWRFSTKWNNTKNNTHTFVRRVGEHSLNEMNIFTNNKKVLFRIKLDVRMG